MFRSLGVAAVAVVPAAAREKGQSKAEPPRQFTLGVVQKELCPRPPPGGVRQRARLGRRARAAVAAGAAPGPEPPFEATEPRLVLKASLNVLQDQGFLEEGL